MKGVKGESLEGRSHEKTKGRNWKGVDLKGRRRGSKGTRGRKGDFHDQRKNCRYNY